MAVLPFTFSSKTKEQLEQRGGFAYFDVKISE